MLKPLFGNWKVIVRQLHTRWLPPSIANFAFPGNPRPKTFSSQQGEVYEVWQRLG